MHFINATNLRRKSGVAEWRDLQFAGGSKSTGEAHPGAAAVFADLPYESWNVRLSSTI
jgi:hypothetical protein